MLTLIGNQEYVNKNLMRRCFTTTDWQTLKFRLTPERCNSYIPLVKHKMALANNLASASKIEKNVYLGFHA